MEFIQAHINVVITTLTLISHIVFVIGILAFLLNAEFRRKLYLFVNQYVLYILFVIVLGALAGSFTQSLIIGFPPCELCWTQRLMLFPQALVLLWAILKKKDNDISQFLAVFSVIGLIVSLYQSLVQWGIGGSLLGCTSVGGDCAKVYVMEYGYITIPLMSFTIFVYLIATSLIYHTSKNVSQ